MTKSIRIDDHAHTLSKIEATRDGTSQQAWISDLVRREVKGRNLDRNRKKRSD